MKLTYETGIATLIQFIILSLLGIANGVNSIATTCHQHSDCVLNAFTSVIFFILTAAWFAALWVVGYAAQERRSKRLAQLLICAEGMVALVAYFNAHHHSDVLSLITSVTDLVLAAWIIFLAFRLMRAKGGRVVAKQGARRRRKHPTVDL